MVSAGYGTLDKRDPNYGLPVNCYLCGVTHKGFGVARITDKSEVLPTSHCVETSLHSALDDDDGAVIRKYWNAPDLEIRKGGEATTDEILAVASAFAERDGTTEH